MGFWERLFKRAPEGRFEVRTAGETPPSRQLPDPFEELYSLGRAIPPPYDPAQLVFLAETNEVHAAALEAVAADTVGQGWGWEATRPGADESVRDDIATTMDEVNPELTFAELLYQAAWELRAVGWSAWEVVRDDDGHVGAVYPIPAHTLRLTRDRSIFVQELNGEFRYFKAFGVDAAIDGSTGEYDEDTEDPASEVILFTRYNGRSRYGIPSWISCVPSIVEYNAIRDYSVAFFDSSGAVGRILRLRAPATMPIEQYIDDLKTELDNAIGHPRKTLVLGFPTEVDFAIERLGPDVQEASFIRRREDLVKAILMAHSVPPYRIGWAVLGSLGGNAAREMLRAYRRGVIEPLQTVLENRINKTLLSGRGLGAVPSGWRWRLNNLDFQETELQLNVATRALDRAIITPNEARAALGFRPIDDAALNTFYLQGRALTTVERPPELPAEANPKGRVADRLLAWKNERWMP